MDINRRTARWVKSSVSAGNGACVEVAKGSEDEVLLRNSRDPDGPVHSFTKAEWVAFLAGVKAGEFDAIV